jgi:hypothetical protein
MKCTGFKEKLVDFIEELLPPSQMKEMEIHMEECPTCRRKWEEYTETFGLLSNTEVPQLSEAKKQALFPLVMERIEERILRRKRRMRWILSLSSAAVLIMISFVSIIHIQNQKKSDIYTIFFNPDNFAYEDDPYVNSYILTSLSEEDTTITDIRNAFSDEWAENTNLETIVDELSDEEIDELIEQLKQIEIKGG